MKPRLIPRFSLLTAVVLMFAASLFVWRNAIGNKYFFRPEEVAYYLVESYGRPCEVYVPGPSGLAIYKVARNAGINLLVAIPSLAALGAVSETFLRRIYRDSAAKNPIATDPNP